MKRYSLIFLFTAIVAVAACEKKTPYDHTEPSNNDNYTFTLLASSEVLEENNDKPLNNVATRTTYTDAGAFSWSANDAISVLFNNGVDEQFFTLTNTSGAGSTATFSGTIDSGFSIGSLGGEKWALYPASANHSFDGTKPTFYIPSETDFTSSGFSANIPMMALGDGDNNFAFKQIGPTYKFTFTGIDESVSNVKLVVENTSGPGLSGNIAMSTDAYIGGYGYFLNFSSSNPKTVSYTRAVDGEHEAEFFVPCRYYGAYAPSITLYDADDLSTPLFTQTATVSKTLTSAKVKRITIPVSGGVWSFTSHYGIDWSSVTTSGVGNTENIQTIKATAIGDYIYLYLEVLESYLLENSSYDYDSAVDLFMGGGEGSADWKWSSSPLYGSMHFCWLVTNGNPSPSSYESNALFNEGFASTHSGTAYYEIKINRPSTGTYSYLYSDSKAQLGILLWNKWYYDSGVHTDYDSYSYAPKGGSLLEVVYP